MFEVSEPNPDIILQDRLHAGLLMDDVTDDIAAHLEHRNLSLTGMYTPFKFHGYLVGAGDRLNCTVTLEDELHLGEFLSLNHHVCAYDITNQN
jgi:hypothetical protein